MKIKSTLKYQLYDQKSSIFIYYLVMILLYTIIGTSMSISLKSNAYVSLDSTYAVYMSGMEMATGIFLFVLALNSFKENFGMFIQNGVSRKTFFLSKLLNTAVLCFVMSFIDTLLLNFGKWIATKADGLYSQGIFEIGYSDYVSSLSPIIKYVESYFYNIFLYSTFIAVGFFITLLYYRMNKVWKIAVSVGVPILCFWILPFMDYYFFHSNISQWSSQFMNKILGFSTSNPLIGMFTMLLISVIFFTISWLLMRRAIVKERN